MKKLFAFSSLLLALLCSTCALAEAPLSPLGPLSPKESALLGPDQNLNGVRDDVDAWIAGAYPDAASREAATLRARWQTLAMLRGSRGTPTSMPELNAMQTVEFCWYDRSEAALGSKAPSLEVFQDVLFNTKARLKAFLVWDASTSGIPSHSPRNPCEHLGEVPKL